MPRPPAGPVGMPASRDPTTVLADVRLPGGDDLFDVVVVAGQVAAMTTSPRVRKGADVIACGGRTIIPGLWDRHLHVTQWAIARTRVDLAATTSAAHAAAVLGREVTRRRAAGAGDELVVAGGMRSALWPALPHLDILDATTGDTPVVATNIDMHTVWCNSAALRRFDATSHTGLLREADGYHVIQALGDIPVATSDRSVAMAMADAAALGVTGIKDFEFIDAVPNWQRRMAAGPASVRVDTTVYPAALDRAIERGWHTGQVVPGSNGLLRAGHLKVFVDGALNSGTALCHEQHPAPGVTTPTISGHRAITTNDLHALVTRAWRHGIAPAIHAIGDAAVTVALDVLADVGCPGRIEHAQLVADADVARFGHEGLVASVQPAHCTDDRDVTDRLWADRSDRAYPLASLVAAGATLEFGSDAPVSPLDPWAAIAVAVTRTDDERPTWHPEQCLDRPSALVAATCGRGEVTQGQPADLVVLDDDPLRCDVATLRHPGVAATMLAGRFTHRRI